jgi:hypothetical protein
MALALERNDERRAAIDEGEKLIERGCVGHNQLLFYPDAIEVALDLADHDAAERYAALLEDFTRPEPLPWSEFFITRGRIFAAVGRGEPNAGIVDALHDLRKKGRAARIAADSGRHRRCAERVVRR